MELPGERNLAERVPVRSAWSRHHQPRPGQRQPLKELLQTSAAHGRSHWTLRPRKKKRCTPGCANLKELSPCSHEKLTCGPQRVGRNPRERHWRAWGTNVSLVPGRPRVLVVTARRSIGCRGAAAASDAALHTIIPGLSAVGPSRLDSTSPHDAHPNRCQCWLD